MTQYYDSMKTSLGDYLRIEAAKRKMPFEALAEMVEYANVNVTGVGFFSPKRDAIKEFDWLVKDYDIVVERNECVEHGVLFGMEKRYNISGTALKFPDKLKKKDQKFQSKG